MQRTIKSAILAVIACLGLAACDQQTAKQPAAVAAADPVPSSSPAPAAPQEPAFGPVDLKATELDLRRVSLPPEEVMAAVVRFNPWRGKYENDTAFAKRMNELGGERLLDGVKVGDLVALRIPKASFGYDANKEEWQYGVSPARLGTSFSYVAVYDELLSSDRGASYREYFAKRGMDVSFRRQVLVEIPALKGYSELVGALKATPDRARQLEGSMIVLLIGRVKPGGSSVDSQEFPTPEKRDMIFKDAIGFKVEGVWLVDSRDGHVLSKAWRARRLG